MDRKRATLTGLAAILLWSTMVGLIRSVSEGLGPGDDLHSQWVIVPGNGRIS